VTDLLAGELFADPGAGNADGYRSALDGWSVNATVRNAPARSLDADSEFRPFFTPELVPAYSHPLVRELGPAAGHELLVRRLHEYLTFTVELESVAILPITNRIARGKLGLDLPPGMQADAHKITTDEAWHAQFSHGLIRQVEASTGILHHPHEPAFLRGLVGIRERLGPDLDGLSDVMFAIVSETLISTLLAKLPRDRRLPAVVRQTISDHALDEGRHHAYFRDLLIQLWPRLSPAVRRRIGPVLPELIQTFLMPDLSALSKSLRAVGLAGPDVQTVIEECYGKESIAQDVAHGSTSAVRHLVAVGALRDPCTRAAFQDARLLDSAELEHCPDD
jgi:hypothetical protein